MALLLVLFSTSQVVSASLGLAAYPQHGTLWLGRDGCLSSSRLLCRARPALPSYGGGLFDGGDIPETGQRLPDEDTTYFPFSAIGALEFTSYSTSPCTGALITPSVVLTVCANTIQLISVKRSAKDLALCGTPAA